ncbi:hypothetical protein AAFF_G00381580, partial [Aldrovandia affinis]
AELGQTQHRNRKDQTGRSRQKPARRVHKSRRTLARICASTSGRRREGTHWHNLPFKTTCCEFMMPGELFLWGEPFRSVSRFCIRRICVNCAELSTSLHILPREARARCPPLSELQR